MGFADFMSTAHSWYKHLPTPPGSIFYVFFHPATMMRALQPFDGSAGYREVENHVRRGHYSDRTTSEYREAYSICSWLSPEIGESMPPTIYDIDGTSLLLPPRISAGTDSLVYLSTMCWQPHPGPAGRQGLDAGIMRDEADAIRERLRRDPECASLGCALRRTIELAQRVEEVDEELAQYNGAQHHNALLHKRHELLEDIYQKQPRDERAAIVDCLVRQAEAIWGRRCS